MTRLNATALAVLRDSGVSPGLWARANYSADGKWFGDVCGCPDDRCANGFHHIGADDCGCLPVLLAEFLKHDGAGMFDPKVLPPVRRPFGGFYRPRFLVAEPCTHDDEFAGVIVFGTHNRAIAQPLADQLAESEAGQGHRAVYSGGGWWRDGFEHGHRSWVTDESAGRAGILFGRIEEGGDQA